MRAPLLVILILALGACSPVIPTAPQLGEPQAVASPSGSADCSDNLCGQNPASVPTEASSPATPTLTPTLDLLLPITEAGVPRVTAEKAKAAFDAGQAVIVDVRTAEAYASRHISGAILIPLADIERDPSAVQLDKTKWIITYCT